MGNDLGKPIDITMSNSGSPLPKCMYCHFARRALSEVKTLVRAWVQVWAGDGRCGLSILIQFIGGKPDLIN